MREQYCGYSFLSLMDILMGEEKGENRGRAYVVDSVRRVAPLLFSPLFAQCERERDTSWRFRYYLCPSMWSSDRT